MTQRVEELKLVTPVEVQSPLIGAEGEFKEGSSSVMLVNRSRRVSDIGYFALDSDEAVVTSATCSIVTSYYATRNSSRRRDRLLRLPRYP
ncbi:hypothetical protein TNCV_4951891 [Trichonephila clavipes]|nr:hypothetical protein TNCV_4951891 [Trichonephila clavipes]